MRLLVAVGTTAAGLLLAGCGSSGGGTGGAAAPTPASPFATSGAGSSAASGSSGAASATSAGASGSAGGSVSATSSAGAVTTASPGAPGVPNVVNGADISKQPQIEAGRGNPPTSLIVVPLVPGSGQVAAPASTVTVRYVGANYANGQVFDSSYGSGQPATFGLSNTIPGFAQGISGMKVGGRREIVVPPALGYGNQANGPIVANETLVFVVDLVAVSA